MKTKEEIQFMLNVKRKALSHHSIEFLKFGLPDKTVYDAMSLKQGLEHQIQSLEWVLNDE